MNSSQDKASREPTNVRPTTVAVVSGKGGTGKTLVSSQLALFLARSGSATTYVDADAEAPNGHLALSPTIEHLQGVEVPHMIVDGDRCTLCGDCVEACAFDALFLGTDGVHTTPQHCRGCGACLLSCSSQAIYESCREVGSIAWGNSHELRFMAAVADIGEQRAVPVIERAIELAQTSADCEWIIVDGPPGNGCPALATLRGADVAILVTEPTPFGAHDLATTADICAALGLPVGVVVNRDGIAESDLAAILEPRGIAVIARIAYDANIARDRERRGDWLSTSSSIRRAITQVADWLEETPALSFRVRQRPARTRQDEDLA